MPRYTDYDEHAVQDDFRVCPTQDGTPSPLVVLIFAWVGVISVAGWLFLVGWAIARLLTGGGQ